MLRACKFFRVCTASSIQTLQLDFECQGKNSCFFFFLQATVRTPYFVCAYFQPSLTFFPYFFSINFETFGVHISRCSLNVNLYNFVRSFQWCNFHSIPNYKWKTFTFPKTHPNNGPRYVYPHFGSLLWLQILFFINIYL